MTEPGSGGLPAASERRYLGLTRRQAAMLLLFIAPALFATNMLVARATHDIVPPVALAFWRWTVTFLLLLPFAGAALWRERRIVLNEWRDLLVLGALGMGVCGAFVYIGADTTSATNIGLIYAASPILIVLCGSLGYHEHLTRRQWLGVAVSFLGMLAIVCRGDLSVLIGLQFVVGDLWILAAMIGWAFYSVFLRYRPSKLSLMVRFTAIVGGGVLVLLPFTLAEAAWGDVMTLDRETVGAVLLLAVVASFGAYQVYGWLQQVLGAGPTSLLMYLIPLYNGVLAFILLDERLELYHLIGAALVLPGIYLATRTPGKAAGKAR